MPRSLPRLTPAALRKAESSAAGKTAGWYQLCKRGYLPAEIALHAEPAAFANDVVQRVREYANRHDLPVPVSCASKRGARTARPVSDWREAFRSNVMRVGMHLSLSQPMLQYLCAVSDGVTWDRSRIGGSSQATPANDIATSGSLEKRGLIRRRPEGSVRKPSPTDPDWYRDSCWELTDAGRCVVDLLKAVGVFAEADAAIERKSQRA